jgi:hypothetical protein
MDQLNMEKYPIYELPVVDFERLIIDLLSATELYENINILADDKFDRGFDLIGNSKATHDGKVSRAIIQIKHRRNFNAQEIRNDIDKAFQHLGDIYEFVLITSSIAPPNLKSGENLLKEFKGFVQKFQLIDRDGIFSLLDHHPDIAQKYFNKIKQDVKKRNLIKTVGIIGSLCSIIALFISIYQFGGIEL